MSAKVLFLYISNVFDLNDLTHFFVSFLRIKQLSLTVLAKYVISVELAFLNDSDR